MSAEPARLRVLGGVALQLEPGAVIRVGRDADNELVLADVNVSRFHVLISFGASGLVVSDLGSLNGTFVNNRRIATPTLLGEGDIVSLADTRIVVDFVGGTKAEDETLMTHSMGMRVVKATLLVADITGYTTMSEHLPAPDVAEMLQRWSDVGSRIVENELGQVQRFLGDSFLAVWGDGDARSALYAARKILEATAGLNETWRHSAYYPWQCKVSLNSGEAMLGPVGNKGVREYALLGDAVNVAFRLNDAATELGSTLVFTRATLDLAGPVKEARSLGSVTVDGRSEAVEVFTLEGE
jgi:adenylate cyclase